MDARGMDRFREAVVSACPELAASAFKLATAGWHSIAVDVDDRLIFKFPRHEVARRALVKEAALLAVIRPEVSIAVPDLRIEAWQSLAAIRDKALPALPPELRASAAAAIAGFEGLPPDPYGTTYGFFDGHGWNMAFDHARGILNGIYDFGDSGLGPLHQEFIYSNFISPDLTGRIVTAYETVTGRGLDRRRIATLTGIHRLSELAELADDPGHAPAMIRHVEGWAVTAGRLR